ncbi:MAG TPA: NAD(P)/FAD-dependent oxidoreductase [Aquabacterium sp.]|nr:NAD(P)/FAD-dependent oxidoreductase [Aquabacterium sp.]
MLDCLVIGAGPAGLVAALYLRRFRRAIRLVSLPGSRALKIERSHNVPGFPRGISGRALLQRLRQQLAMVDGTVVEAAVTRLQRSDEGFVADLGGTSLAARTVLLATGVEDIEPALPGVDDLQRHGRLRHCPVCDGHEHLGWRIAVLGRGDHGAREALFLRRFSSHVVLFDMQADDPVPEARQAQLERAGIIHVAAAPTAAHVGASGEVRLMLTDSAVHEADVAYAALGCRPRSALAGELGAKLDERGSIVTDAHLSTCVPGLYAAGDVVSALDQIAVAHGHAAIAATAIHNSLD